MESICYKNKSIKEILNESQLLIDNLHNPYYYEEFIPKIAQILSTKGFIRFSEFIDITSEIHKLVPTSWNQKLFYSTYSEERYMFSRHNYLFQIITESINDRESVKNFLRIMFYFFKLFIHYNEVCNCKYIFRLYSSIASAIDYYSISETNIEEDCKFISDINQILDDSEIYSNKNNYYDNDNINRISDINRISIIISILKHNSSFASDLESETDFIFNFIIKSGVKLFKINDYEYLASFNKYFKLTDENIQLVEKYYNDHHKYQLNFIIVTFHRYLTLKFDLFLNSNNNNNILTASVYNIFNKFSNEQLTSSITITRINKFISKDVCSFILVHLYTQRNLPIPDNIYNHIVSIVNRDILMEESPRYIDINFRVQYLVTDYVPSLHFLTSRPWQMVNEALLALYKHNQNQTSFISIYFYIINLLDVPGKYKINLVEPFIHLFKNEFILKKGKLIINKSTFPFLVYVSHFCTHSQLVEICLELLNEDAYQFKSIIESLRISELENKGLFWKEICSSGKHQDQIFSYISNSNEMHAIYGLLDFLFKNPYLYLFTENASKLDIAGLLCSLKKNNLGLFKYLIDEIVILPHINILIDDIHGISKELIGYLPVMGKDLSLKTTPNYIVIQEIFKYLILDKRLTTKWKVELSTISRKIHSICSAILSNYAIDSLEIKQTIQYIGSQYCLFRSTPLHLNDYEIQFIPKQHMMTCLEDLESISHHFNFFFNFDNIYIQLVNCKNIRSINIHNNGGKGRVNVFNDIKYENQILKTVSINYNSTIFDNQTGELEDKYGRKYKQFMKLILDHYDNDKLESVLYTNGKNENMISTIQTHSILENYQKTKPINIHLHYILSTQSIYFQYLPPLNLIKTLEISTGELTKSWFKWEEMFKNIKYLILKINYKITTNDGKEYKNLLQLVEDFFNLISINSHLKSVQFAEVFITHNDKVYSLFNIYNINVYRINFGHFKPVDSTNSISKFYRGKPN